LSPDAAPAACLGMTRRRGTCVLVAAAGRVSLAALRRRREAHPVRGSFVGTALRFTLEGGLAKAATAIVGRLLGVCLG
jgi:hypothetical protein